MIGFGKNAELGTLEMMTMAADVEEGEISDGSSNDAVSIRKVRKRDSQGVEANATNAKRVWTMRDLYNYQMAGGGCVPGLYNLAWAQAVQNKPLDDLLDEVIEPSTSGEKSVSSKPMGSEREIEEGELEEGEIDLDSNPVCVELNVDSKNICIELLRETLQSLTAQVPEKSFETIVAKLCATLEDAAAPFSSFPLTDEFKQTLFKTLHAANTFYASMDIESKQRNIPYISRVFSLVNTHYPNLFNEEIKEFETTIASLSTTEASKPSSSESPKPNFKSKLGLQPLIDLHKDHDLDSLPSPTRESTPLKAPSMPDMFRWSKPLERVEPKLHPYETDAVKAVSSYQQKFGKSSFFSSDRLPSPTPSDDSDNDNQRDVSDVTSAPPIETPVLPPFVTVSTSKPSRSRDPRLRMLSNSESTQNQPKVSVTNGHDTFVDGPLFKKQKSDVEINEERRTASSTNNEVASIQQLSSVLASFPEILKSFAANPTLLMNVLSMVQQSKFTSTSNSPKPPETIRANTNTNTLDEPGKIKLKPQDPRRALHNNIQPKSVPSITDSKPRIQPLTPSETSSSFNKRNTSDYTPVSQPPLTQTTPFPAKPESRNLEIVAASRPLNAWENVEHFFTGYDDKQKAAIQKERARRMEEQRKLFSARKLCLVLDLDHTLLNSAKFSEVDPIHDEILRMKEEQDREKPQRHLFRFPHMGMWTKLRPGIWTFLERASKLFELHLYTMGNKLYATEMAKVLDPKGALFAGRVISRGDDGDPFDETERAPKTKDLEGVLGMESSVVIIDDSVRVWPHNKLNLIVVERYIYFPCSRRQFGLPGPSLLEIDHDERPEDGTLACSLAVIERIHQNFFSHQSLEEGDVRNILANEQRKILAGCRVVFSRIFPVGEANPQLHPLWQTAEQFGATCTNQIDDHVTHVVANSLGTDKVNWALSSGKFVVRPGWVEASALLYRRANELDFAIKS